MPLWQYIIKILLAFFLCRWSGMLLGELLVIPPLLTVRFHSIWAACGFHSLWNYLLFNIYGLNLSGIDSPVPVLLNFQARGETVLNGGQIGLEASVITTAVLSILLILLVIRRKKAGHSES